ncbi:hypothetical protein FOCC_FOCC011338 [Frankliniella occidentalis]|nr:hypothetical protein FOCC_FOCC011338 [Frankliniella occidentalis]
MYHEYRTQVPITTVQSTHYHVSLVPFPAVAICDINKIRKSRVQALAAKLIREHGLASVTQEELTGLLRFLGRLYDHSREGEEYIMRLEELFITYNVTLDYRGVMQMLGTQCDELLLACRWAGKAKPCTELFETRKTMEGYCCTFNYVRPTDNFDTRLHANGSIATEAFNGCSFPAVAGVQPQRLPRHGERRAHREARHGAGGGVLHAQLRYHQADGGGRGPEQGAPRLPIQQREDSLLQLLFVLGLSHGLPRAVHAQPVRLPALLLARQGQGRDVADSTAAAGPPRLGARDDPVTRVQRMLPGLRRHGVPRGDHQHAPAAGAHGPLQLPAGIQGGEPQRVPHLLRLYQPVAHEQERANGVARSAQQRRRHLRRVRRLQRHERHRIPLLLHATGLRGAQLAPPHVSGARRGGRQRGLPGLHAGAAHGAQARRGGARRPPGPPLPQGAAQRRGRPNPDHRARRRRPLQLGALLVPLAAAIAPGTAAWPAQILGAY